MGNLYGYDHSRISSLETELSIREIAAYSQCRECRSCGKIADVNADSCCVVCDDLLREN
jgi:hypothetical protein